MKDHKALAFYNLLSVILVLSVNYASQARLWGAPTIGEISRRIQTMITPASYAFAIWGVIYLWLIAARHDTNPDTSMPRMRPAPGFIRGYDHGHPLSAARFSGLFTYTQGVICLHPTGPNHCSI